MGKRKIDDNEKQRCAWVTNDPLYIQYHDEEWGKPQRDGLKLFEMICLEGQQAGLSWITILKKRVNYQKLFFNFDPVKIAVLPTSDVEAIGKDTGIIRHKAKVSAIVNNAKCYLNMKNNGEDFSTFIWEFVNDKPIINNWNGSNIPTSTPISKLMSQELKKRGFKFVGPTICYAFMQACGLVNDHIISCCSRRDNNIKNL